MKVDDSHSNEVTFVISRNIKSGYEKQYDDWLRRYLAIERKAPGYLGTTIIMPGGTNSTISTYRIVPYILSALNTSVLYERSKESF
jgi:antibiotic biosynthesis monooxygenase (ABM) superfamily enzyme